MGRMPTTALLAFPRDGRSFGISHPQTPNRLLRRVLESFASPLTLVFPALPPSLDHSFCRGPMAVVPLIYAPHGQDLYSAGSRARGHYFVEPV